MDTNEQEWTDDSPVTWDMPAVGVDGKDIFSSDSDFFSPGQKLLVQMITSTHNLAADAVKQGYTPDEHDHSPLAKHLKMVMALEIIFRNIAYTRMKTEGEVQVLVTSLKVMSTQGFDPEYRKQGLQALEQLEKLQADRKESREARLN